MSSWSKATLSRRESDRRERPLSASSYGRTWITFSGDSVPAQPLLERLVGVGGAGAGRQDPGDDLCDFGQVL